MSAVASVDALRERARRQLPRLVFDFVDGGAEGETTLAANRAAFEDLTFAQPCAVAPPPRNLRTTVLGKPQTMPLLIAPCGAARVVHPEGERALARAAAGVGIPYVFPHVAGHPLATIEPPPTWYQLYLIGGREWAEPALERAWMAGCRTLVVTADGGGRGVNERNVRNGLMQLMEARPRAAAPYVGQLLARPRWLTGFVRDAGRFELPNVRVDGSPPVSHGDMLAGRVRGSGIAWADLAWIRASWPGDLVIKGVLRPDDARRAHDEGAAAVIVSNHGGRQLDGAPATMRVLEAVAAAAEGRLEVLLDGGVRRGGDVVKALCLGARAVLVGRASLWGLAVDGERGVARALDLLRDGIDRTMGLLGCERVEDLARELVTWGDGEGGVR